jgi:alcohol dehydrogenase class IV
VESSQHFVGDCMAGMFSEPAQHTPIQVTEQAMARVEREGPDCVVAVGGGSAIGLGKAIALRTKLPLIALPTTYAGSEMTALLGQTEKGEKTTLRDESVRPRIVIYDPALTATLPLSMSVSSGLNSIAHAVEALYAPDTNPVIELMALAGIRSMVEGLTVLLDDLNDPVARRNCLQGAWLCGHCLGSVSMGLHHKLCHTLGGLFDLPHAPMHALLLPYSIAYNAPAMPNIMEQLTHAFGGPPEQVITGLLTRAELPTSLAQVGMPADGVAKVIDAVLKNPYRNPRPITSETLGRMLQAAWGGADSGNIG